MQLYEIVPGDPGGWWEIQGPGVDAGWLSFTSRSTADQVAAALARAFVKGQESVLSSQSGDRTVFDSAVERLRANLREEQARRAALERDREMLVSTVHELRNAIVPVIIAARCADLTPEAASAVLDKSSAAHERVLEWAVRIAEHLAANDDTVGCGVGGGPSDGNHEGKPQRAVHVASNARPWREEVVDLGLEIVEYNAGAHVQLRQDGKVFAEWWPGKGTTMMDGKRGPKCATGEDVVAWLKNA